MFSLDRQQALKAAFARLPLWIWLLICGFSLAAIGILTIERPLIHRGNLDPLIYQAYIFDYGSLVERYGYTYFSSRVAWILPSALAQNLFGSVPGFLLIRILLLGAAASAMALLISRFCRWPFAVYAAAWVALSPLILRSFAHEYVDGAATSYSIIAMSLVFTAKPKAWLEHFFGGVFFALASNAYTLSILIPICLVVPWFILRRRVDEALNITNILAAIGGFMAAYLGIAVLIWHTFSQAGQPFEVIPLSKIGALVTGEAANWWTSLGVVFLERGEYFKGYPLFLAVGLGLAALGLKSGATAEGCASDREIAGILALLCGSMTAAYLTIHFVIKAGLIAIPYGYIYALPVCGLGGVWLLDRLTPQRYVLPVCVAGLVLFLASISASFMQIWLVAPKGLWLLAGLVIAASGLAWTRPSVRPLVAAGIAASLLLPLSFYATDYGGCLQNKVQRSSYVACMRQDPADFKIEENMRNGTFRLLEDVDAVIPVIYEPGFWYTKDIDFADQIDMSFLQYGGISSARNMPLIDGFATHIVGSREYLILVGPTPDHVDAGIKALADKGMTVQPLRRRTVGDADFSFAYAVVHTR